MMYAKNIGFKTSEESSERRPRRIIVRRFGWTREENPNKKVGLLFDNDMHPGAMHEFRFRRWPCYTLEELLPEILKKCQRDRLVPCVIWMDEQDLIPSLKVVLKNACESVGVDEMIGVEWYPPPSEEERAFVEEHA